MKFKAMRLDEVAKGLRCGQRRREVGQGQSSRGSKIGEMSKRGKEWQMKLGGPGRV